MHSLDAALAQLRDSSSSGTRLSTSRRIDRLEQTVCELAGALVRRDCAACEAPVCVVIDADLPGQRPRTATERARLEKGLCPDCGAEWPVGQSVVRLRHENVSGASVDRSSLPRTADTSPEPGARGACAVQRAGEGRASTRAAGVRRAGIHAERPSPVWPCPTCGAGVVVHGQLCNDCALAAAERRSYPVARSRRR